MFEDSEALATCPICRCPALLDLCDPAGLALCPSCGREKLQSLSGMGVK